MITAIIIREVFMKSIAVYCGSRMPNDPKFKEESIKLADYFVENKIKLLYGGATVGIMGVIADRMLEQGGYVVGVMPQVLVDQEFLHEGLSEMHLVEDMPSRKTKLIEMADHFIAFPGGCGTMDEIFEVITLGQIGVLDKSYGFLNINGFYDGIKQYIDHATDMAFIPQEMSEKIIFEDEFEPFIKRLLQ